MSIPQKESIVLRQLRTPAPWEAFIIPVDAFPVPDSSLSHIRWLLQDLTSALVREQTLIPEVFIQVSRLSLAGGAGRYSAHAREWLTRLGLGVWPDREPPAMWTVEKFMDLAGGEDRPILMHKVFRVTPPGRARENARDVMLGTGTVLLIMTSGDSEGLFAKGRQTLLEPIKDEAFRNFSFYVPLLEVKTLETASAPQLEQWFCGASAYIRESVEDKAILIASKEPLAPVLRKLSCRWESENEPGWRIPVSAFDR